MLMCFHVACLLLFSYFKESWIFSTTFLLMVKYQISLKFFHLQPSYFMRTYGQTDKTKLVVAFCELAQLPSIIAISLTSLL